MGYVAKNLMKGEEVVYQTSLHWLAYSWPIVLGVVGLIGLLANVGVGLAFLLVAAVIGVAVYISVSNAEFAVTNKRAISVEQGLSGKLWGFGTIVISGTGGSHEPFKNIADPFEFRKQVQEQIASVQDAPRTFVTASATPLPARAERECPYCAETILAKARICKHCGKEVEPLGV